MSEPAVSPDEGPARDAVVRLAVPATDRIAFGDVLARLARRWWVIAAAVAATMALAAWYTATAPKVYTARMVIAPVGDKGAGALAGRLAQYAQVASLAGLNLRPGQEVTNFDRFVRIVGSAALAERLEARHGLMRRLFAGSWDADSGTWKRPPMGMLGTLRGALLRAFGLPDWTPPSTAQLGRYLRGHVLIKGVLRSAMREMVFEYPDRKFALALLQWVYREGDDYLRAIARQRTERQIAYIQHKLATVTVAEHRQALIEILSAQERGLMMMQVNLPFAVEVVEPPTVSDRPTSPRPLRNLALAAVAGFGIGIVAVFVIDGVRGRRTG